MTKLILLAAVLATTGYPVALLHAQAVPPLDAPITSGPTGARLDSLMRHVADSGFAGAVLVAVRGKVLLLQGYGLADRSTGARNSPTTLFDYGSITKTLTGVAVLVLDARGRLSVDAPLSRYVGAVDSSKARATIDHLAKHTSGFVVAGSDVGDSTRRGFIEKMRAAPGESEPGVKYRYSNAGASLLAAIVEDRAGKPFADFVRDAIFRPAGIRGGFRWEPEWDARRARGYAGKPGEPPVEAKGPPLEWSVIGATGWLGTVGDVYRFHRALRGGKILPAAQLARTMDSTTTEAYGFHFEPHSRYGVPAVHKGGDFPGFQSQYLWFPGQDVVIIWANNDQRTRWRDILNKGLSAIALEGAGK